MNFARNSACWWILFAVIAARALAAEPPHSSPKLADAGWISLFDGQSFAGWQTMGDAKWTVAQNAITTRGERPGWLMTTKEWADFELRVEFKAPATTNSGIFLRTVLLPTDPTQDCYELNIAPEDNPFPTGSLVGRLKTQTPLDVWDDAWHTFEITAVGGKIVIRCDGQLVGEYDDSSPIRRGHVGLQSKDGGIEFRKIRLREIRGQ